MSARTEPVPGPELLLTVDRASPTALHEQLELRLRELVRSGRLAPGTRLPSSRALARKLGLSRGVVLEAYSQLSAEGYFTATQGAPTRVASTPAAERPPVPAALLASRYDYDFDPGLPDMASFPRARWLRALRAALAKAPFDALGPGDPRGIPELRNELMRYLGRARGAAPEPEHTIVCAGFTQGFAALCRALRDRGLDSIAVEEPGWPRHRLIAERAGLEPVPVAVDGEGIDVAELAGRGCEAVVLTPAHQFPTGVPLSSARRAALVEWAEDRDGLIVEDDYDSELRYDRMAVGALQGLTPERVCNLGSLSKRLTPGLRLGWMLSPSWLTGALTYESAVAGGGCPVPEQLALAEFISSGELDRHLRRMRIRYRERRLALLEALARELPGARVLGVPAGTFALVVLPGGIDEPGLVSACAERGVAVQCLDDGSASLVLGYASLAEPAIARAVALLRQAVESTQS
jgi:GntR family transcriptional regulator / MocR family aminotransferase